MKRIFEQFWHNMKWNQREMYVSNSVNYVSKKRRRKREDASLFRRSAAFQYELNIMKINM